MSVFSSAYMLALLQPLYLCCHWGLYAIKIYTRHHEVNRNFLQNMKYKTFKEYQVPGDK